MAGWKKILSQAPTADITIPDATGTVALTGSGVSQDFGGTVTALTLVASTDGNIGTADSISIIGTGQIRFEGSVADGHETNLKVTNPTDTRNIFLPDAGGTVALETYVDSEIVSAAQYEYEHIVCNYSSSSSGYAYFPLCGYVVEQSSLISSNSEYVSMVMPHDGIFYKMFWRPSITQTSATAGFKMYIGSNGDTHATELNFSSRITGFALQANNTYENEVGVTTTFVAGTFGGNESNAFSAGDIISIGFDPTVGPGDVKCTIVLRYDMTT